jgi:hypothetical protein
MKKGMLLSFIAGFILAAIFLGAIQTSSDTSQNGLSYPGHTCLWYVSTWVNRNEIWHDYRLSEEAEAAGFKIRAVRGDVAGHLISVRVSQ